MIDIGFFGLTARWISSVAAEPTVVQLFITALVLWQLVYRSNFEICVNLMDEFLEKNMINIVASPLRKKEWILAMMLSGLLKMSFTFLFGVGVGWLFFRVNVLELGWILVPFAIFCLISGWIIGFLGAGILIYKGARLQQLPWVIITLAALFSCVFVPVHTMPLWMKWIAQILPMSYIFQGLRHLITTGTLSSSYLVMASFLSIFYLTLAIKLFLIMFEKSRQRGFNRFS